MYNELEYWRKSKEKIFNYFLKNLNEIGEEVILIKVLLIDGLYGTNLKNIPGGSGVLRAAEMIHESYKNDNLLDLILGGDKNALIVMDQRSEKYLGRSSLSFVTKYCHFHNKERFPIYDKYVFAALNDKKIKCCISKIKLEENFYDVMDELLKKTELNFEDLDTFLWLYGLKLKFEKNHKINKEAERVFKKYPHLVCALQIK